MRPVLLLLFGWCLPVVLLAQNRQQFADLGNFGLESGQTIQKCRISYRTLGRLNAAKTNAILIPTYFSGTAGQLEGYVGGAGKLLDSTRFFVILVDALGNGASSSPSNSQAQPGTAFPTFSIRDMVATQYALVTQKLGIKHLHAVMGISMGGMQTFQWMVSHPTMMDKVIPIIGSPKQSFNDLLLWNAELRPIETACPGKEAEAMQTVALIHSYALFTPTYRAQQNPLEFEQFLQKELEHAKSRHPYDWAAQLRAMIGHDIYKTIPLDELAKKVKVKMMFIYAAQDMMVNPTNTAELAKWVEAEHVILSGDCGHMATGCEYAKVVEAVNRFLAE